MDRKLYEVMVEPANGLRIAGARRAKGERIELFETEAMFHVLDGVLQEVQPEPAPAPKGGKKNADA